MRKLLTEVLQSAGYRILSADDGETALDLAQRFSEPIHILITDVIMRKLGGTAVAGQLTRNRPRLRVLYMSGFTEDAVIRNGILNDSVAFLQKPFSPPQILALVRKLLDAPDTTRTARTARGGNAPV